MSKTKQVTAIIEHEKNGYISYCLKLDIASQGKTIEEACSNLVEAFGFFEISDPSKVQARLITEVFITHLEVNVG